MSAGEFVRFELVANGLNIGQPLNLFDGNGEGRTLGGGERLNITFLHAEFGSANPARLLTIFDDGAVGSPNNIVDAGEATYFTMGVGSAQVNFSDEGLACGLGRVPTAISANGVGASSVTITGAGHITNG